MTSSVNDVRQKTDSTCLPKVAITLVLKVLGEATPT
jgi:hypothetical protein